MFSGYMGKMLFVDLSKREIKGEVMSEELYRDFCGGYGIGARVIFTRQKPRVDPLGPDSMLGFVTGILTGTPAPGGSRYVVVGKSPLTGTWGDANSGGDFGPYLKFSGYDALFFSGKSEKPVYLFVQNGKAELRDASDLWGKDVNQTEDILKARHGEGTRVACIGPAGEKVSFISCIVTDKGRVAGRSGLGALMGSKKLKAIAVKGTREVPIAEADRIKQLRRKHLPRIRNHPLAVFMGKLGTPGSTVPNAQQGRSPVKNWGGIGIKDFQNAGAISAETALKLVEKKYGCWHCPVACGATMKAGSEYRYQAGVHRPEYETSCSFGTLCLNDNYESIVMANDICNRYGLDTISAGSTIAFVIECYENGLITPKDTDGIEMTWGNHNAIVAMTEKLAKREGFGAIIADGVKEAAGRIGKGATKYAIHVGGQEIPMHDPKLLPGFALAYITDATPGRHSQCGTEEKVTAEEYKKSNCLLHAYSSAGLCLFYYLMGEHDMTLDFLNAVTGHQYTIDEFTNVGERIANIRQAFNIRENVNPLQFRLPSRVIGEPPQTEGPNAGVTINVSSTVKEYLKAMDWDLTTGKPSKKKLLELGLEDVARTLWPE